MVLLNNLNERRLEAKELLYEFRKMYSNLKTRIKKYEIKLAGLHEEEDKMLIMYVTECVQLALNKFILVNKSMTLCDTILKNYDNEFKILQQLSTGPQYLLNDRVSRCSRHLYSFNDPLRRGENEIRIANKHLKKINDHIVFLRSMNRVPKRWKGEGMVFPFTIDRDRLSVRG